MTLLKCMLSAHQFKSSNTLRKSQKFKSKFCQLWNSHTRISSRGGWDLQLLNQQHKLAKPFLKPTLTRASCRSTSLYLAILKLKCDLKQQLNYHYLQRTAHQISSSPKFYHLWNSNLPLSHPNTLKEAWHTLSANWQAHSLAMKLPNTWFPWSPSSWRTIIQRS